MLDKLLQWCSTLVPAQLDGGRAAGTVNSAMQAEPIKADPPKRKRRWFQFSLRTLMIGVTLFCVVVGGYVGWQVKIVKEREAFYGAYGRDWFGGNVDSISWLRRRLGDRGFFIVLLPPESSEELHRQATTLFPETSVVPFRKMVRRVPRSAFPLPEIRPVIGDQPIDTTYVPQVAAEISRGLSER